MSIERKVPLDVARDAAIELRAALVPACHRIEIAGSIRRRVELVGDIELVADPRLGRDLFGELDPARRTDLELLVDELVRGGRLEPRYTEAGQARRGRRYQALRDARSGLVVDLFSVLPPASWGATLAIRTGPAEYSKRLVTVCQDRGLRCVEGRLVRGRDTTVPTPTEESFIEACGLAVVEPWRRA